MEEAPTYHKGGKVLAGESGGVRYMAYWFRGVRHLERHAQLGEVARCRQSGCIRMLNQDVIALFQQVDVGTPVIVTAN